MATVGDLVQIHTTLGPTGRLGEAPVLGRVVTATNGVLSVIWENGVATENLPDGMGFLDILTEPDPAIVAALFLRLVRHKPAPDIGAAEQWGYVAGLFTVTHDQSGATPEQRVLILTLAGHYVSYAASDVEEIPGHSGVRPWYSFPQHR